eukprot:RCo050719
MPMPIPSTTHRSALVFSLRLSLQAPTASGTNVGCLNLQKMEFLCAAIITVIPVHVFCVESVWKVYLVTKVCKKEMCMRAVACALPSGVFCGCHLWCFSAFMAVWISSWVTFSFQGSVCMLWEGDKSEDKKAGGGVVPVGP